MTPTARSIEQLRKAGFAVYRAEHWNAFARRRIDAFGFGDLLVAHPERGIGLIQVTTYAHMKERREKIDGIPAARTWIESGGWIAIHGWKRIGPRGCPKTWYCDENLILRLGAISRIGTSEQGKSPRRRK